MSRRYAEGTKVPPERSRAEIERLVRTFGAKGFRYAEEDAYVSLDFKYEGRWVRFAFEVERDDERETWRLWRVLLLVVKSKIEVVRNGLVTFEEEFLSNIVLDDETTIGARIVPNLDALTARTLPPAHTRVLLLPETTP